MHFFSSPYNGKYSDKTYTLTTEEYQELSDTLTSANMNKDQEKKIMKKVQAALIDQIYALDGILAQELRKHFVGLDGSRAAPVEPKAP